MLTYLRIQLPFIGLIFSWVFVAAFMGPVIYLYLPLTLLLLKSKEYWPELLFGFIMVLVFSDMHRGVKEMYAFKQVKNLAVLVLAAVFLLERWRFVPFSRVFNVFLPFFIYSIFPLVYSNTIFTSIQKTISFALIYLIIPNYVLYNFRLQGWSFFRDLSIFLVAILASGYVMAAINPGYAAYHGRFNGIFGNPNGMAIFGFLVFVFIGLLTSIKKDLFSWPLRLLLQAVILYFVILSGSRGALAAVLIFTLFGRFFTASPFLGFVALVLVVGIAEGIVSNLGTVVTALGLEEFFRLKTLEEGSGRYFAWAFAWGRIQNFIVFGGGFGNDEYQMRIHYDYLNRMGHQGGVHNSYLSMWLNMGIVGLLIYFRSFILLFVKASKLVPMSTAAMFAILFSINYESWLVASLNPFTIILLMIMTVSTEEEIALWDDDREEIAEKEEELATS